MQQPGHVSGETEEFSAATVEAAIEQGLRALGLERDQVDVGVRQEPSRGILGIGAREAIVRLTPRVARSPRAAVAAEGELARSAEQPEAGAPVAGAPARPELRGRREEVPAADDWSARGETLAPEITTPPLDRSESERIAADTLRELIELMGFHAGVHPHWIEPESDEDSETLVLDVQGQDLGVLIGHRGETLGALQAMVRLIAARRLAGPLDIVIDVAGYKARREQQLRRMAQQAASQAVERGRTMLLEPMPANERRIIHVTLRDHPQVTTRSVGEGGQRKVTIVPKPREP